MSLEFWGFLRSSVMFWCPTWAAPGLWSSIALVCFREKKRNDSVRLDFMGIQISSIFSAKEDISNKYLAYFRWEKQFLDHASAVKEYFIQHVLLYYSTKRSRRNSVEQNTIKIRLITSKQAISADSWTQILPAKPNPAAATTRLPRKEAKSLTPKI